MEQEISILLKEYGLKEEEAKIYIFLVINGELTAYKIAKGTKIHRSTCYDILEKLVNKKFVSKIEKGNKLVFYANELTKVISGLKEKEEILKNLMSKIKEIEKQEDTKIKLLDNASSQKEFNINILELAKKREISFFYCISNGPSKINYELNSLNILIEKLIDEVFKKKLFKNIDYKGIWDFRFKRSRFLKIFNKLGKNKFLNLPTKTTTIIFDNYVAFLFTDETSKVIEIKSKKVSEEMKAYFKYLWKLAS